ncbi:hypothetical protein ABT061_25860 [Streptosporangium sp. NPDC002544]|uniref:hypothetical protein n=1 Tax=Streptosporangium sp. NPDC002544 TaxID=3154538 RepID=UPI003332076F
MIVLDQTLEPRKDGFQDLEQVARSGVFDLDKERIGPERRGDVVELFGLELRQDIGCGADENMPVPDLDAVAGRKTSVGDALCDRTAGNEHIGQ